MTVSNTSQASVGITLYLWNFSDSYTSASFAANSASGHAPLTIIFTETSSAPTGITAWQWDFGDSVTSTLQNPSHQYTAIGPHTVALTIDSGLEADRATQVITINTPVPLCHNT